MTSILSRYSIKEPIPAIFEAWKLLSKAVDAHLQGEAMLADSLFRRANIQEIWHWVNPAWERPDLNVKIQKPAGDTQVIPKAKRCSPRHPGRSVKMAVLKRDGYRCRYCGIPVVSADIRNLAHRLYPDAVPWSASDVRAQHAAFQCFWLQYDHVLPHSHGGASTEENVVVCCALCNYGKDKYTLRQLEILDPRLRPPVAAAWDGLERLRGKQSLKLPHPKLPVSYFIAGAWISGGYVYTPAIDGKQRWFKIDETLRAEPDWRFGVDGCRMICDPDVFLSRGLSPDDFRVSQDWRSNAIPRLP